MFYCNTDEEKILLPGGAAVCSLQTLPMSAGFLWGPRFPLTSQRCAREANVVSTVSPSECGCEWLCLAGCSVRVGPSLCLPDAELG